MAIDKLKTSSLEDNSVTSPKLAPGAVTEDDISDSSLPLSKLSEVDLNIAPEILEIQVSAPAAGQATTWLWTWLTSSLPYARRTITNSPELQVPLYKQGTYTVNNFAAYDLFDSMTQTHSLYLKWIDGAGTDNLVSWATSTGPVSDTHPDINGGNATDVQRINISVPATITVPTLTPPSVSYTVVNNGAGAYTFSGSASGDNPNLGPFYRGGTYTINITATGHPFYFTTDNGTNFAAGTYFGEYTDGVTGSRTDSGTITFTVPNDAPDTLYYQCGNHGVMRGAITVKNLAVETNINGNYVVYFQHTQEGHKTPVELRPIPSLVNQMCLVYDADSGKFVPQDLATYVENTPSFENKIREVAGTAELVVEDGSAVIAKVNVYDDSTYLPLVGNNPGDQAFATDTDILYIWDGSAWQQAGASNSDDLTEGTTNLFYTDARVNTYLSSNGYDTATNIVATITDSAPATLDTLNELAAALGDDPNFATTVTNNIATKLSSADFNSTADTWLGTKDTDDVTEGSSNLYHTTARVQSTAINAGSLRGSVNNATLQYGTSYSGTPIQGSFFFDSLNQKLKVYTGSTFVDAVPAGAGGGGGGGETAANATFRKYTYSITSGTNAVSGADDNAETLSYVTDGTQNVEVYRNGVKMVEGASNDYVATTGTSVNFTYNLESGDTVDIQVYELLTNDAFYLKTETYTQTEVNSQISTGLSGYLPLSGNNTVTGYNDFSLGLRAGDIGVGGTDTSGSLNLTIQTFNDDPLHLQYSSSGDIRMVQGGGNVGIGGNAVPSRRLFIHGSGNRSDVQLSYNGLTNGDGVQLGIQPAGAYIWNFETAENVGDIYFGTANTRKMTLTTSGNLGIGINDPVASLDLQNRTDAVVIPRGTTAQRPSSPVNGMLRYNTDLQGTEEYKNGSWAVLSNVFVAVGGTENTYEIGGTGYKSHTFTTSGTFVVQSGVSDVEYLVVGGGGGGGGHMDGSWYNDPGGGGGAGGMITGTMQLSPGSYTVTIGAGGASRATAHALNGGNSVFHTVTANGGGGGGAGASNSDNNQRFGQAGGSGGGSGGPGNNTNVPPGGSGTTGQGNAGGSGGDSDPQKQLGGGGGGKGAAGQDANFITDISGAGGIGAQNNYSTGNNIYYAGGGGAGGSNQFSGADGRYGQSGGQGGGGRGGDNGNSSSTATAGSANTGGGGGGAGGNTTTGAYVGKDGGSGIVVIRYAV